MGHVTLTTPLFYKFEEIMSGLTLEKHVSDGCDFHSTYSVCALHLQAYRITFCFVTRIESCALCNL